MKFTGFVLIVQGITDAVTRYRADKIIEKLKKQANGDYIDADYTIK